MKCYRKKYWRDLNLAIAWQFADSPNLVPCQHLFLYSISQTCKISLLLHEIEGEAEVKVKC